MASFTPALTNTEKWEGGYSNNPNDSGGETYRGISRHSFPSWSGWAIIDATSNKNDLNSNASLQVLVGDFYHSTFWKYGAINNQAVANKLFDCAVNVGTVHSTKIAQQVCNIPMDGLIGPNTISAINQKASDAFLSAFDSAAEAYHKAIAADNPRDAAFLAGWLRRDAA